MFAIIATGGKQYKVKTDDVINIELVEAEAGTKITFENVLAIGDGAQLKIGAPNVAGAKVEAEVIKEFRGEKLIVFKMKRRKGFRKKTGHRQSLMEVKITNIIAG